MISYGAYVHHCMRVAEKLSAEGIEAAVLDLRSLAPLDKDAILAVTRHCNRVLIVHEDSRTGGIGESLAAIIQEEAFESLDAPIRILGALDTPVPYSPPLEEFFLVSEAEILQVGATVEPVLMQSRCRISFRRISAMRRLSLSVAVFACVSWLLIVHRLSADVRTDQRVKFQLGGAHRQARQHVRRQGRARRRRPRRSPSRAIARRRCRIRPGRSST